MIRLKPVLEDELLQTTELVWNYRYRSLVLMENVEMRLPTFPLSFLALKFIYPSLYETN